MTASPIDFPYLRIVEEPDASQQAAPFLVASMVTGSHVEFGKRLISSCQSHGLPILQFEVPSVHSSISPSGSDDLRFSKPNLIRYTLERYQRPVLYLDADMVIEQSPENIFLLVTNHIDFAVFNWLAEEDTAAFMPIDAIIDNEGTIPNRFFRFSHSIDQYSQSQLICSGGAQFYANSPSARKLLTAWQDLIALTPKSADDHCLDFTFNNRRGDMADLKYAWFDKSYCRHGWWIFTRPVLNHPELPTSGARTTSIENYQGKKRVYLDNAEIRIENPLLRECFIDAWERAIFRLEETNLVRVGHISDEMWLMK